MEPVAPACVPAAPALDPNQASVVLSTLVPAAGIVNTGFAFHDYNEVWKAMDGPLGAYVRAQIVALAAAMGDAS